MDVSHTRGSITASLVRVMRSQTVSMPPPLLAPLFQKSTHAASTVYEGKNTSRPSGTPFAQFTSALLSPQGPAPVSPGDDPCMRRAVHPRPCPSC